MKDLLKKADLPAIGLCKVTLNAPPEIWVIGTRQKGKDDPAQPGDRWHLGSDTKAFTAGLVLLEAKRFGKRLDLRVAKELGVSKPDKIHAGVTFRNLLDMKGNLAEDPEKDWMEYELKGGSEPEKRQKLSEEVLSAEGKEKGNELVYSNTGYVLLGHLVEKWSGKSYEEEMASMLFQPLKLSTAIFAPPKAGEPMAHRDGKVIPGMFSDNPPIMAPAGELRISLADWATYCVHVLKCARGESSILPREYARLMAEASDQNGYGSGWVKLRQPWSKGPIYAHSGSNSANFATAFLAPSEGVAYLAVTNDGSAKAGPALNILITYLIDPAAVIKARGKSSHPGPR